MDRLPWMFSVIGQVFGTSLEWKDELDTNDEEYHSKIENSAIVTATDANSPIPVIQKKT